MRSQESDTTERLSVIACNIALGITSNFQLAQMVKNLPVMQETRRGFDPWVGKIPWRREWLPTPVFLPGEFHGQRSLVGYSL